MSKPKKPLNPVIPPGMVEDSAIQHIVLKGQIPPNNGRREGCTGVRATCTRTAAPFCNRCNRI